MLHTSSYVAIDPDNDKTFSNEYAILMQAIGGEFDSFFKEYCELVYKENYDEAQWNYGRYFLDLVDEQIELITNPLGLPWYI